MFNGIAINPDAKHVKCVEVVVVGADYCRV